LLSITNDLDEVLLAIIFCSVFCVIVNLGIHNPVFLSRLVPLGHLLGGSFLIVFSLIVFSLTVFLTVILTVFLAGSFLAGFF